MNTESKNIVIRNQCLSCHAALINLIETNFHIEHEHGCEEHENNASHGRVCFVQARAFFYFTSKFYRKYNAELLHGQPHYRNKVIVVYKLLDHYLSISAI